MIIRAKLNLSNQYIAFKKLKKKLWIKTREEDVQVLAEMDLVVDDSAEPWIEPIQQQRKKQGEAISNSTISIELWNQRLQVAENNQFVNASSIKQRTI